MDQSASRSVVLLCSGPAMMRLDVRFGDLTAVSGDVVSLVAVSGDWGPRSGSSGGGPNAKALETAVL